MADDVLLFNRNVLGGWPAVTYLPDDYYDWRLSNDDRCVGGINCAHLELVGLDEDGLPDDRVPDLVLMSEVIRAIYDDYGVQPVMWLEGASLHALIPFTDGPAAARTVAQAIGVHDDRPDNMRIAWDDRVMLVQPK